MTGLVGNAPASAIKNEINYLQTNNLENLRRNKRSPGIGNTLGKIGSKTLPVLNSSLTPLQKGTKIVSNTSTIVANIFNMYQKHLFLQILL